MYYVCVYVSMYVCMYVCVCVCKYVYIMYGCKYYIINTNILCVGQ